MVNGPEIAPLSVGGGYIFSTPEGTQGRDPGGMGPKA
jgi:hypothetical protein